MDASTTISFWVLNQEREGRRCNSIFDLRSRKKEISWILWGLKEKSILVKWDIRK